VLGDRALHPVGEEVGEVRQPPLGRELADDRRIAAVETDDEHARRHGL
jgi:hypothetical protein